MYKKIFLICVLFFPRIINASGDKLSDGSCQFDIGTGYKSTKVYINNRQNSYVILSFHDPRYGTTKYIYNGNTCESLTSGDSKKSSYEKLMQKNGFDKIIYSTQKRRYSEYNKVDKWFGSTTTLTVNPSKDIITLAIQPFETNTQNELNIVLNSISNKNSKYTNFSRKLKKIIDKNYFKKRIANKISKTSTNAINYDYTLSLLSQLNNFKSLKLSLATKYFESKYYERFAKNASNNFLSFIQNNIESRLHNKFIKIKKPILSIKEKEEFYSINISSGQYDISYKINKKCNTHYNNRTTKRNVRNNGDTYNITHQDKNYGCSIIGGLASSRLELDTLFSNVASRKGYSYSKNFMSRNNLIPTKNREEVSSKYVGVDTATQQTYRQKQIAYDVSEQARIRESCKHIYVGQVFEGETGRGWLAHDAQHRVLGFSLTTGKVSVVNTRTGYKQETKCDVIPR